ncbi:unnamed protein product [Rangifer tarandus platyrhynchus]|uniref:Uncharacterized protein n=1 Tax=Rangifer tarandus platyrhynchus TaxID=3082113 RepID=A0ABN8YT87_RANTA|nr:unnamed protein product [Rangifer tarandus platyrhynchus]
MSDWPGAGSASGSCLPSRPQEQPQGSSLREPASRSSGDAGTFRVAFTPEPGEDRWKNFWQVRRSTVSGREDASPRVSSLAF